jgi:ABC-type transport system involved in multi-copper enzyme maturation permease subunit
MPVPLRWRIGQMVALALVGLLAVYYNTIGWKSVSGTVAPGITWGDQFGFVILAGLIWFTTPIAGTIAVTTLQEAFRRRWVLGFVGFSMVVLVGMTNFTHIQMGEEFRVLQDFGTGFIIGMTLLIAIFLGVALVPPEIERRTIFTILSKPVNRLEFLIGKFLGLCLTLFVCLFLLGAFFLAVYAVFNLKQYGTSVWSTGPATAPQATLPFAMMNIAKALILHGGQLAILAALSLTLSLIVSPITAITFCFLAYFGGQMSSYWGHLGGDDHAGHDEDESIDTRSLSKPMQMVVKIVYYVLPRMDRFDVRSQLVTDTSVGTAVVWKAWSNGLVYIAAMLIVAYLVFSDREF